MIPLRLQAYKNTQLFKDIPFPPGIRYRQVLVIGPPGVGKSTLIRRLGGWTEEGHLDLATTDWWRSPVLFFTPRELHLYLPFQGVKESLSVYDPKWLDSPTPLDFPRIHVPPAKSSFLRTDWRHKFAFEFLLPPVDKIVTWRQARAELGTHRVDCQISPEHITRQMLVFWNVAKHLHRCGLMAYIRQGPDEPPLEMIDTMDPEWQDITSQ